MTYEQLHRRQWSYSSENDQSSCFQTPKLARALYLRRASDRGALHGPAPRPVGTSAALRRPSGGRHQNACGEGARWVLSPGTGQDKAALPSILRFRAAGPLLLPAARDIGAKRIKIDDYCGKRQHGCAQCTGAATCATGTIGFTGRLCVMISFYLVDPTTSFAQIACALHHIHYIVFVSLTWCHSTSVASHERIRFADRYSNVSRLPRMYAHALASNECIFQHKKEKGPLKGHQC